MEWAKDPHEICVVEKYDNFICIKMRSFFESCYFEIGQSIFKEGVNFTRRKVKILLHYYIAAEWLLPSYGMYAAVYVLEWLGLAQYQYNYSSFLDNATPTCK